MDLRQTKGFGRYMETKGWVVENGVFIRKLPLIPLSILKYQRWEGELNLEKLNEIRKKYRVVYSVLEPLQKLKHLGGQAGYRLSSSPYLPTKTIVIDLTKSESQLLKEMSKDARQKLKHLGGQARQIKNEELAGFREEWKKQKKGYVASLDSLTNLKKSFGDDCWILEASLEETPLGGVVILLSSDTAFYYFAWTNEKGREMGAQYKLVWEAMKMAKEKGLKKFDLEGIYDERWPLPRWKGFTAFKKKFGGEEVIFPGSWQKWF